jgi:hypothetical protein
MALLVHELYVVNRDDGKEPDLVRNVCRENRTVYFAFEDNNTIVLGVVHDELISRVQSDIVAHTRSTEPSNWPVLESSEANRESRRETQKKHHRRPCKFWPPRWPSREAT